MANTYKNIVITPNTGSTTGDPTIVFSGGDSTTNTDVTLRVYPTSNGTLSVEGAAGQLFSITNDLSNTIFSVNDVSGLPLVEVNVSSQQITLGQYYGNVGIGTSGSTSSTYKLDVTGTANISSQTLVVGGTNVIAAIVAANSNNITQGANIATLAGSFVSANSAINTRVDGLSSFSNTNTSLVQSNLTTLVNTFYSANANNVSLAANLATFIGFVATANANATSLSTNVNILAATFTNSNSSLTTLTSNVGTLVNTFYLANANGVSLSTNVNQLAANVNTLAGAAYPKVGGTISGDVAITGNLTISGTQTYANTQTLLIGDNTLVLNADIPGNVIATENAGLVVNRGNKSGNAQFLWIESANAWGFTGNSNAAITTYVVSNTSFESANAAVNARVDGLSSNTNTFYGFFTTANANSISLSTNVNQLATNVGSFYTTFVAANANSISLSTNVNQLAANVGSFYATFISANANNVSLAANLATFIGFVATANANTVSLSTNVNQLAANVNTIAGAITNLTLENLPGAFTKRSVTAATTANIALFGTQTIDGVAVSAGNRVLVKDQLLANQNGIYIVAAGAWSRSTDADTIDEIASAMVAVDAGTTNGGKTFDNDIKITDTLNTTSITWNRIIDDGSIYTYAAPITAYGALNVAYLAANTNAASLSANVNTLAAAVVSNNASQGANIAILAATFVAANANNVSLAANVNVLAAAYAANIVSLSTNVNTLAATVTPNTAASRFAGTANNADLLDGFHASVFLANTSGTSFAGNFFVPTGNVGIGTSNPTYKLETTNAKIADHIFDTSGIEVSGGSTGNRYAFIDLHGDDTYTDYSVRIVRFNSGANAPSYIQHRGTGELGIQTLDAAPISLYTNSAISAFISSSGNVGIGTTSPSYKLDVTGSARTTGDIYANSSNVVSHAGIGGRVLVGTITGNNVASLATTSALSSAYRNYEIVFENLLPVTQSVALWMQLYGGGAYLNAASGYYNMGYGLFNDNTGSFHTLNPSSVIQMTYSTYFITTATGGSGISGTLYLYNASSSTTYKSWDYKVNGPTYTSGYTALYIGSGWYNASTAALTGFQMFASSGNITGTVRVYGYN